MQTTSKPVASGSSVPVWPIFVLRGEPVLDSVHDIARSHPPGYSITRNAVHGSLSQRFGLFGQCGETTVRSERICPACAADFNPSALSALTQS